MSLKLLTMYRGAREAMSHTSPVMELEDAGPSLRFDVEVEDALFSVRVLTEARTRCRDCREKDLVGFVVSRRRAYAIVSVQELMLEM